MKKKLSYSVLEERYNKLKKYIADNKIEKIRKENKQLKKKHIEDSLLIQEFIKKK